MIKRVFSLIMVFSILLSTFVVLVPKAFAASQVDINAAIEKGLVNLNGTQASDGHWGGGWYPVACTAMAVLSFENAPNSHYSWNLTDPYSTTVQKGLDWLFAQAGVQVLSNQTAGNPDTNGNGIGIYFSTGDTVYQTPMVLMAIVASGNQSQGRVEIATTGPANVAGRSYYNITVDIVDWLAWAQNEAGTGRGGWRYDPNSADSDNSNTQWPVLGLMAAELWGINAPAFVESELLNYWVPYTQNLAGNYSTNYFYGAFGYGDSYWGPTGLETIAETSAGILELTYCGVDKTDPRIMAAQGYIARDWLTNSGWRCNIGNFYAMYAVMKACRLVTPTPIEFIANYTGDPSIEWYNGSGKYADELVTNQCSDGHWDQWVAPESVATELSTAWGVLILEFVPVRVEYTLTVHVVDANTNSSISGANVMAVGPQNRSGVTDGGTVVFYKTQAGSYTVTASKIGYTSASTGVMLNMDREVTVALTSSVHPATVIIEPERVAVRDPDTLNLKSKGNWVNCSIMLPEGYNASDINASTLLLNGTVTADLGSASVQDSQLMAKFNRTLVSNLILSKGIMYGNVTLTVTAQLYDGTMFEGNDTIGVKMPGDVNMDGKVDIYDAIAAASAFGSYPGHLTWNSAADENDDGIVNIFDVITIASNFGKTYM